MKIKELEKGEAIINLMVKSKNQKEGAKGAYLDIELTDGMETILAKRWDSTLEDFAPEAGDVINVKLNVGEYNGKPNYIMTGYRAAKDYDIKEFIRTVPVEPEIMFANILTMAEMLEEPVKEMVTAVYTDYREKILHWSAAKTVHHNLVGGLLYHTYRMAKTAFALCEIYTEADADIVVAGVLLHDIGKLEELDTDKFGNASYTVDGNLFGHLLLGSDILMDYAKKLGTPDETVRQLRHVIISHHGKLEYDAIKVPCTMEAMLVNMIDVIDARCYQFEEIKKTQEAGTVSEQKYFALDGIHVYIPTKKED